MARLSEALDAVQLAAKNTAEVIWSTQVSPEWHPAEVPPGTREAQFAYAGGSGLKLTCFETDEAHVLLCHRRPVGFTPAPGHFQRCLTNSKRQVTACEGPSASTALTIRFDGGSTNFSEFGTRSPVRWGAELESGLWCSANTGSLEELVSSRPTLFCDDGTWVSLGRRDSKWFAEEESNGTPRVARKAPIPVLRVGPPNNR